MIQFLTQISRDDVSQFAALESLIDSGWTKKMLFDAFDSGSSRFAKAVSCGKIVGYINFCVVLDEAEINSVAVCSNFQRQGIAQGLIDCLCDELVTLGVRAVFLEVSEQNEPAIKLYQKCGFCKISERKNYYGKQSALIYKKNLSL